MPLCLESTAKPAYISGVVRWLKFCNTRPLPSGPVENTEHCSMMIIDAIGSAPTQHAVYFLVTAYIESLSHFERSCGVPAEALVLPIRGRGDLEARAGALDRHTVVPFEAIVPISELTAVLRCAVERLGALAETASAAVRPHARNDNRRSALSV